MEERWAAKAKAPQEPHAHSYARPNSSSSVETHIRSASRTVISGSGHQDIDFTGHSTRLHHSPQLPWLLKIGLLARYSKNSRPSSWRTSSSVPPAPAGLVPSRG